MTQSTVLPPMQMKAAELAAPAGRAAPEAGDKPAAGVSFGEVLQAQIDKGLPVAEARVPDGLPPADLPIDPDIETAAAPIDPGAVGVATMAAMPMLALPVAAVSIVAAPTVAGRTAVVSGTGGPAPIAPRTEGAEPRAGTDSGLQAALPADHGEPTVATTPATAPAASGPGVRDSDRTAVPGPVAESGITVQRAPAGARSDHAPDPGSDAGAAARAQAARGEVQDTTPGRQSIAPADGAAASHARSDVDRADALTAATPVATMPAVGTDVPAPTLAATEIRRDSGSAAPWKVDVAPPIGAPGWRDAFADRVTWIANVRQPSAEMHINPPNLGPVEIRINLSADQASLSFYSPHAAVRDAIQAALPRLTDAFAASGLTLGNVFVGAQSQSGQQTAQGNGDARFFGRIGEVFPTVEATQQTTLLRPGGSAGRVDIFA